jgi:hypothetical protein
MTGFDLKNHAYLYNVLSLTFKAGDQSETTLLPESVERSDRRSQGEMWQVRVGEWRQIYGSLAGRSRD